MKLDEQALPLTQGQLDYGWRRKLLARVRSGRWAISW